MPLQTKFEVGDRVKVVGKGSVFYGRGGVVDAVYMLGFFGVTLKNGKALSFSAKELEKYE